MQNEHGNAIICRENSNAVELAFHYPVLQLRFSPLLLSINFKKSFYQNKKVRYIK